MDMRFSVGGQFGIIIRLYLFYACVNTLAMYHAMGIFSDVSFIRGKVDMRWHVYFCLVGLLTVATFFVSALTEKLKIWFLKKYIGRDYDLVMDILYPGWWWTFLPLGLVLLAVHGIAVEFLPVTWIQSLIDPSVFFLKEGMLAAMVWLILLLMCVGLYSLLNIINGCMMHMRRVQEYREMGYEYEWD